MICAGTELLVNGLVSSSSTACLQKSILICVCVSVLCSHNLWAVRGGREMPNLLLELGLSSRSWDPLLLSYSVLPWGAGLQRHHLEEWKAWKNPGKAEVQAAQRGEVSAGISLHQTDCHSQ